MKLLNESKVVAKAYAIAEKAHAGQVDKGGNAYIEHPLAVANLVTTEEEKAVALLHDVVEDTHITLELLRSLEFSDRIVEAVDCLTKREDEDLGAYLLRVKCNTLATIVKIADLTHNSDLSRLSKPNEKDFARTERYKREIAFLLDSEALLFTR